MEFRVPTWPTLLLVGLIAGCSDGGGDSSGGTAGSAGGGGASSGGRAGAGTGAAGGGGLAGSGAGGMTSGGGAGAAGSGAAASGGAPGGGGSSSGGSAGSGGGCPSNPPSGPFPRSFDVAALNCNPTGACTGNEDKCFCSQDFDALNVSPTHFMAMGSDKHKSKIWSAGNGQAAYVDDLNTNWTAGGANRANDVMASAKKLFPCGVPKWFIVNEVSPALWPGNATYRDFVVEFAKTLSGTHGRTVVVTAPFDNPGKNGAWWSALAQHAFVGAQVYLSGKEVNAKGNSVAWCQSQYQASINAYANRGVAKNRLFLFEHFGNTLPSVGWGRAGVSSAGWHNAIKARAQALKNLKLTGFVSYGWGGNDMHAPQADRLAFMQTYLQQRLP